MIVDLFLVYQFIRRLATPFEKWPAYELGIIDKDGNILKKRKDLNKIAERNAFGVFDVMILNLKKILAKVPGGSSKIASYAAALYLIREWNHFSTDSLLTEDISDKQLNESIELFYDRYINYIILPEDVNINIHNSELDEEPTNSVGGGNIAGMDGTAFSKAAQKKWTSQNKSSKKKRLRDIIGAKT